MADRDSLSLIYAVLMDATDELNVDEIATRCDGKVRPPTITQVMFQMVKRGLADEHGTSPKRFFITALGRQSIDIVEAGKSNLQRPKKTYADIEREVARNQAIANTGTVAFPRVDLRLLAQAALASARPLDEKLRAVILSAIKEAA